MRFDLDRRQMLGSQDQHRIPPKMQVAAARGQQGASFRAASQMQSNVFHPLLHQGEQQPARRAVRRIEEAGAWFDVSPASFFWDNVEQPRRIVRAGANNFDDLETQRACAISLAVCLVNRKRYVILSISSMPFVHRSRDPEDALLDAPACRSVPVERGLCLNGLSRFGVGRIDCRQQADLKILSLEWKYATAKQEWKEITASTESKTGHLSAITICHLSRIVQRDRLGEKVLAERIGVATDS